MCCCIEASGLQRGAGGCVLGASMEERVALCNQIEAWLRGDGNGNDQDSQKEEVECGGQLLVATGTTTGCASENVWNFRKSVRFKDLREHACFVQNFSVLFIVFCRFSSQKSYRQAFIVLVDASVGLFVLRKLGGYDDLDILDSVLKLRDKRAFLVIPPFDSEASLALR